MTLTITHSFIDGHLDGPDATLVRPSNWNDTHNIVNGTTGTGAVVLAGSPALTGTPTGPTAAPGNATSQLANTAFVTNAIVASTAGVASFNTRTGTVTLTAADVTGVGGITNPSPALTGTPTAPTAAPGTATTQIASTAFVTNAIVASTAGVASFNTRTGAVTLTLADVTGVGGAAVASIPVVATTVPLINGTAAIGASGKWADGAHVHPTDTTRAAASALAGYLPLTGGTMTGGLTVNADINVNRNNNTGVVYFGNSFSQYLYFDGANWTLQAGGTFNVAASILSSGSIEANAYLWTFGGVVFFEPSGSYYIQLSGNTLTMPTCNLSVAGTISAGATLSVNGIVSATNVFQGAGYQCKTGTAGGFGGNIFNFYWDGSNLFSFIDVTNVGVVSISSDYRIKKDVMNLPGMWDTVKALRPIKYTHNDFTPPVELEKGRAADDPFFKADDIERWGFIAHELQETLIDSAATAVKDAPDAIQSPNPWPVIAALTKALQEAMKRIEQLETIAAGP